MAISPELTGGGGFTFEAAVCATYLASLLLEGGVRGLAGCTAKGVLLQRAAAGMPLDDVIVTGEDANARPVTLHLQVKQSLTISAATGNDDFRAIVHCAWQTFRKPDFQDAIDRVGGATGEVSNARFRSINTLCERARYTAHADDFHICLKAAGSNELKNDWNVITKLVKEIEPDVTEEAIWRFVRCFLILRFDLLHVGAEGEHDAIERLRHALAPETADSAGLLWSRLRTMAADGAARMASFSRADLLNSLSEFKFLPGRSVAGDLRKLDEEAGLALNSIKDTIGGYRIVRSTLFDNAAARLEESRCLFLLGEPGTGKSALLKALAEAQRQQGIVMMLSAHRLPAGGWSALASQWRLTADSLKEVLTCPPRIGPGDKFGTWNPTKEADPWPGRISRQSRSSASCGKRRS